MSGATLAKERGGSCRGRLSVYQRDPDQGEAGQGACCAGWRAEVESGQRKRRIEGALSYLPERVIEISLKDVGIQMTAF